MRRDRIWAAMAATVIIALAAVAAVQAAPRPGPCVAIRTACEQAGFVRGGARTGDGLVVDCIRPIMQGTFQRPKASRPLPQVDAQLVAACKERNPGFGQRKAQPATMTQPPAASPPAPPAPPPTILPRSDKPPNIVFILTDDLSLNLLQFMPHVRDMQAKGVTFANYFVTDSLCCPSRSSIFTGRYPHNTGIFRNTGDDGGYVAFHHRGHEATSFATALEAAGYRTAMLGKYLNGYQPTRDPKPPGWTTWAVAGNAYRSFDYDLNQDGTVVHYGNRPADYITDVLSGLAVRFIGQSAGTPFAIEVATFAPHAPYTPAPRDADALPGLVAPRTAAFDSPTDAEAPRWLRQRRPLSETDIAGIDRDFRRRAQSVLAIDKMIGELQAAVAAIGEADNTYFVFSSDNGYHMGEYRLLPGKMTAYDTDVHVPLIVTGPGVPAGRTVEEIVENIDLAPTFTEIAGAAATGEVDGRSLLPLLHGDAVAGWRTLALIEHHGPVRDATDPDLPARRSGNPTTYEAIRGPSFLYVEYASGEREYHDLATDAYELHNTFAALDEQQKAWLHAALVAAQSCRGAASCGAAERTAQQARAAQPR